jgi:hypothetical protein
MRYRGRVIVPKIDINGDKIKDYKKWRKKHPRAKSFDSKTEWEVWKFMKDSDINYKEQPALLLFDGIETKEFVKPRQTKKAKKEGRNKREIKKVKQHSISYTPDYYLPDYDTYIEVKGFADDVFKLRWKLFKLAGYKGFIVYSLDEFKELYKQLSDDS